MKYWELAQLNIATLIAPIDTPALAGFVAELDRLNGIADQSHGFIWRLKSNDGNATEVEHVFGTEIIVNMSVWKTVEQLHTYVYRTAHAEIMSRRKEWFKLMKEAYTVLWWIPEGHIPTIHEAKLRLELLQVKGSTPDAFTFKTNFPNPSDMDQGDPQTLDEQFPVF